MDVRKLMFDDEATIRSLTSCDTRYGLVINFIKFGGFWRSFAGITIQAEKIMFETR